MTYDFVIPLALGDLLKRTSLTQYVVEEVLPVRVLAGKLQETKAKLRMIGPFVIEQNFDALYSVLGHFHEVDNQMKDDLYDILVKAVATLADQLVEGLDGTMDPSVRKQRLNIVKMSLYLLCQTMDLLEAGKPAATVSVTGRGRKKAVRRCSDGMEWETDRVRGVRAMAMLVQLQLHQLWDNACVEDDFVTMVSGCCYKLLESPVTVKDKDTRDTIFQLLGLMVKKYGHALSCTIKIIQLLQHFEHLATPFACALQMWAVDLGVKSIVGDILRDIGRLDPRDLARDTSGTRAYASFLVELAERVPELILPSVCVLMPLLDGESYTMRNSVLSVLGEMIVRVLSGDNLNEKMKTTRNSFLDVLEDHIHDVNAFSRSRTLQVWILIVNEKKLPLPRQQSMVELALGRLQDKSSQVRKQAVQLLTSLLQSNPFSAKLPVDELEMSYQKEKEKLDEMMPEQPQTPEKGLRAELEEQWSRMEKHVTEAVNLAVETPDNGEETDIEPTLIPDDATPENVREQIVALLKEHKYQSALQVLRAAHDAFPAESCFTALPANINKSLEAAASDAEMPEEETESELDPEERTQALVSGFLRTLKNIYLGDGTSMAMLLEAVSSSAEAGQKQTSPSGSGVVNEVSKQQVLVQYLKDSLAFAKHLERAVPIICQLLGSKSSLDVLEAIEFFVTGMEFGVHCALIGVRRMLVLIWSKEASIKDSVVSAYRRLYLSPKATSAKARSLEVVANLTSLTYGATLCDLMSLEELVCELVKSGELDNRIIQTLWERFSRKTPDTTDEASRGALLLISMAAGADVNIVRSNVDVLIQEGLGVRAENDPGLTKDTCVALRKLTGPPTSKGIHSSEPFRLPADHEMFERLSHLVVSVVSNTKTRMWVPMAEEAVNVIYKLAENPDLICTKALKKIAALVLTAGDEGQDSEEMQKTASVTLSRLLSFAGHVALRQLIHLDVDVLNELKRRSAVNEKAYSKKAANKDKSTAKGEELTAEEEMGMAGASADDTEAEYIRTITEEKLVSGPNLLAVLHELILLVVNNPTKYDDADLQTAATLALSKYMVVSTKYCEDNLQLLFTVLEKSPHSVIRANTIVALGDLTFRFPNSIEPWTPNLYGRLRDTSPRVRKNTLMVLTHLILHDMIKVKGQISELASCIVDHDEQIQARAKLFFHELAKKGNAVYNIMPDIISRLSDPELGVPEDHFRTIMKYLFTFIEKDRQCESLVEKLCHRFRATRNYRQWRDLAYCLSMLTYSERSIRKLQEEFACYADKLGEPDVYNSFTVIMDGAKKLAKLELKAMVEEFEERIQSLHQKGLGEDEVAQKASEAVAAARAKGKRTPGKRGRGRGTRTSRTRTSSGSKRRSLEEDDDSDSGSEFAVPVHPARRAAKTPRNVKTKPKLVFSDDEDDDIELFVMEDKEGDSNTASKEASDAENADPNTLLQKHLTPRLPLRKVSRHKSVSTQQASQSPELPRRGAGGRKKSSRI